jgi:glycosyltransferase involved in cell wall biosynthesis
MVFPHYEHKYTAYLRYVLPTVYRRAAKIISVSENTRRDLIRFYDLAPEKIKVIPEAIDHDLFKVCRADGKPSERLEKYGLPERFILSVSSNLPHKNLPRLIRAYGLVKKSFDIPLVIVGYLTPKYQREILEIMKESDLDEKDVRFLGHFPITDLPAIYSACELFVFVSLYEGFGFPPLEAMACGAPVVVSNAASIPEVVASSGLYVNPYEVVSIAEGIKKCLSSDPLRKELRQKGLAQAKKFSWDRAAEETLKVFREVAAEG